MRSSAADSIACILGFTEGGRKDEIDEDRSIGSFLVLRCGATPLSSSAAKTRGPVGASRSPDGASR